MKYLDFFQHFTGRWHSSVFSIDDIKNVFPDFNNVQLHQWQEKGYIRKIRKQQYFFSQKIEDFRLLSHDLKKSYISMEYALSYYEWIPESVFNITAIATDRGEEVKLGIGPVIIYRTMKNSLFLGYNLKPSESQPKRLYALAFPEKALFDLVYLRHDLAAVKDFASLRLTISNFKINRFKTYLNLVQHPGRKTRLELLLKYIKKEYL